MAWTIKSNKKLLIRLEKARQEIHEIRSELYGMTSVESEREKLTYPLSKALDHLFVTKNQIKEVTQPESLCRSLDLFDVLKAEKYTENQKIFYQYFEKQILGEVSGTNFSGYYVDNDLLLSIPGRISKVLYAMDTILDGRNFWIRVWPETRDNETLLRVIVQRKAE